MKPARQISFQLIRSNYFLSLFLVCLISAIYLLIAPQSADLAAHVFRSDLFRREGFTIFNNQWYGGHHTPSYSLLFPPLGALLGPRLVGAISIIVSTILFAALINRHTSDDNQATGETFSPTAGRISIILFAFASSTSLWSGRMPFAFGLAVGLGALVALDRQRKFLAVILGAICPLASPVAGAFLALVTFGWFLSRRKPIGLIIAVISGAVILLFVLAFPEGGNQPFSHSAFWSELALIGLVVFLIPARYSTIRLATALYLLVFIGAYLIPSPLGSNVTRLGALFGVSVLAAVLIKNRPLALSLLILPFVWWQWQPAVRDVATAWGKPETRISYYQPLIDYLQTHTTGPIRIEIPFTQTHWETAYVAPKFALARGWERQLDIKYNSLFYDKHNELTPQSYYDWLKNNGVSYVALPDSSLDRSARKEAAIIKTGLPFLQPVWKDEHWRVFNVKNSPGLVIGGAQLEGLSPQSFQLASSGPSRVIVRLRFNRFWRVSHGLGCLSETKDHWTAIEVFGPSRLKVGAGLSGSRCVKQ